jgi:hypothetical protein
VAARPGCVRVRPDPARSEVVNGRRAAGAERRHGSGRGESSEGIKELHERSGMKEGRSACRGASRQEGAKPWRRNEPGRASPGGWTRQVGCAEGAANLMRGAAQHAATRQPPVVKLCRRSNSVDGSPEVLLALRAQGDREDLVARRGGSTDLPQRQGRGGSAEPMSQYRLPGHTSRERMTPREETHGIRTPS